MCEDMVATAREMFAAAGIEEVGVDRTMLTEGWSIHELGTARMGADPKSSVLNQFQQSHDVPNLFVVDGSNLVTGGRNHPTLTIQALAFRAADHIVRAAKTGTLTKL